MSDTALRTSELPPLGAADAVLNALPLPVIIVDSNGRIADANVAAENFFEASVLLLRRQMLRDLVPFGSPLLALVEQVRDRGAAVNEYKVDLSTPRTPGDRLVDLHVAPLPERHDHVVVMLQERTIADKMDRQLTHRGAARSVSALAAMLAHHGLRIGLKHARKHLGWALDAAASTAGVALDTLKRWRSTVLTSETPAAVRAHLAEAYQAFADGVAA